MYYTKEYITQKIHKGVYMTGILDDLKQACRITYIEISLTKILR